jgi:iron(III) transport system ATP-binding protein
VADFIGDANLIDGHMTEKDSGFATVRLDTLEIRLPARGLEPGPVKVAIRPDAIRLDQSPPADGGMEARVRKAAYLGKHVEYGIESPLGELFVVDYARKEPLPIGSTVWLSLARHGVVIVLDA